ncbi:MAG: DNA methyltransferase [Patescibacteria group bacterium]|nr:DNA methyltransferase [Patescibacteria group bacterium]
MTTIPHSEKLSKTAQKARYFFILGNNPALSRAEIFSLLARRGINYHLDSADSDVLTIDLLNPSPAEEILSLLGGTIKIGRVITETSFTRIEEALGLPSIMSELSSHQGKIVFGLSVYGGRGRVPPQEIDRMGITLKRLLKKPGQAVRYIKSRSNPLSSVIIAKNKLIEKGGEIVLLLSQEDRVTLGLTLAVQDFEDYSRRDYGRPSRNMKQGMLPPKLAKMMVNLSEAKPEDSLVDPFCGSGTILQEAWLLGYKNLYGSDNNPQAIQDSKTNLAWLKEQYHLSNIRLSLKIQDAKTLSQALPEKSIDAIVTEPFLGPATLPRERERLENAQKQILNLYSETFKNFNRITKPEGRIVIIVPRWRFGKNDIVFNLHKIIQQTGFSLVSFPGWVGRQPFEYQRPNQNVIREIFVLKKNS